MKAISKTRPAPGFEIIEAPEPEPGPGEVKLRVKAASVCGTDLHIYNWDAWASARIRPPRIVGHEFCGEIIAVGEGVSPLRIGEFVASESHIVDPNSEWLKAGLGHLDPNSTILGVDVDGGFRTFTCIPQENARVTDPSVPVSIACFQDALGNAVHTVNDGPVKGLDVLITGMGPIGLFAVAICRTLGARTIVATEPSEYRAELARKVGADLVINPLEGDAYVQLGNKFKDGFDAVLEMSGKGPSLQLGIRLAKPGGRISLLGVYPGYVDQLDINAAIFKGLQMRGIIGRKLWETWDQMGELLAAGLNVAPVVTHELPMEQINEAMEMMRAGTTGKVVLHF